jgi:hypothetical protein
MTRSSVGRPDTEGRRLSGTDRITLVMLAFYLVLAFTLELYFVLFHGTLPARHDVFADAYRLYGRGDRNYYNGPDPYLPLALEALNIAVTQIVNLVLIWAILRARWWRHALQLIMASYLTYSVVLYFTATTWSSLGSTALWRGRAGLILFIVPNLPWLLGPIYLGYQSAVTILRALRARESTGPEAAE